MQFESTSVRLREDCRASTCSVRLPCRSITRLTNHIEISKDASRFLVRTNLSLELHDFCTIELTTNHKNDVKPQERISRRTVEWIDEKSVSQVMKETVKVVNCVPQERLQQRIVESCCHRLSSFSHKSHRRRFCLDHLVTMPEHSQPSPLQVLHDGNWTGVCVLELRVSPDGPGTASACDSS